MRGGSGRGKSIYFVLFTLFLSTYCWAGPLEDCQAGIQDALGSALRLSECSTRRDMEVWRADMLNAARQSGVDVFEVWPCGSGPRGPGYAAFTPGQGECRNVFAEDLRGLYQQTVRTANFEALAANTDRGGTADVRRRAQGAFEEVEQTTSDWQPIPGTSPKMWENTKDHRVRIEGVPGIFRTSGEADHYLRERERIEASGRENRNQADASMAAPENRFFCIPRQESRGWENAAMMTTSVGSAIGMIGAGVLSPILAFLTARKDQRIAKRQIEASETMARQNAELGWPTYMGYGHGSGSAFGGGGYGLYGMGMGSGSGYGPNGYGGQGYGPGGGGIYGGGPGGISAGVGNVGTDIGSAAQGLLGGIAGLMNGGVTLSANSGAGAGYGPYGPGGRYGYGGSPGGGGGAYFDANVYGPGGGYYSGGYPGGGGVYGPGAGMYGPGGGGGMYGTGGGGGLYGPGAGGGGAYFDAGMGGPGSGMYPGAYPGGGGGGYFDAGMGGPSGGYYGPGGPGGGAYFDVGMGGPGGGMYPGGPGGGAYSDVGLMGPGGGVYPGVYPGGGGGAYFDAGMGGPGGGMYPGAYPGGGGYPGGAGGGGAYFDVGLGGPGGSGGMYGRGGGGYPGGGVTCMTSPCPGSGNLYYDVGLHGGPGSGASTGDWRYQTSVPNAGNANLNYGLYSGVGARGQVSGFPSVYNNGGLYANTRGVNGNGVMYVNGSGGIPPGATLAYPNGLTQGQVFVNAQGQLVNAQGQPVNAQGQVIAGFQASGGLSGTAIAGTGQAQVNAETQRQLADRLAQNMAAIARIEADNLQLQMMMGGSTTTPSVLGRVQATGTVTTSPVQTTTQPAVTVPTGAPGTGPVGPGGTGASGAANVP